MISALSCFHEHLLRYFLWLPLLSASLGCKLSIASRGIFCTVIGFLCGSDSKESTCNAGDLGLIPGFGRSVRGGHGYPLQYSGLENSMDCIVHRVAKSRTWLKHFHFNMCFMHIVTWLTDKNYSTPLKLFHSSISQKGIFSFHLSLFSGERTECQRGEVMLTASELCL